MSTIPKSLSHICKHTRVQFSRTISQASAVHRSFLNTRSLATSSRTSRDSPEKMNLISNLLFEVVPESAKGKSFYDLKATLPGSKGELDFAGFKGKAVLIVNTASKCGFTPQYTGLEELHKIYHDKGLEVLGFPSNEFGGQDPGSDDEIASFCQLNHGVSFPLMKKSEVNGTNMNEVFAWLKANGANVPGAGGLAGTTAIKWNFTKFLVDRHGQVVGRYSPSTTPEHMKAEIEKLLA